MINQLDCWHGGIDSRNKGWFVNFQLGMVKRAISQSDFRILIAATAVRFLKLEGKSSSGSHFM